MRICFFESARNSGYTTSQKPHHHKMQLFVREEEFIGVIELQKFYVNARDLTHAEV